MELKNKRVIVTGAGSGIGKNITLQLLEKGALVAAADINEESLNLLKEEVKSDNLKTFIVDMSDSSSINKFRDDYIKELSYVDILINNAGIIQPFVTIDELDNSIINKVMNVNFFGPVTLTKLFLKDIKKRAEGYIINISSMGGFFPFPCQSIYGASKAALKLFTEGLYAELLDTNVKVMVVMPGAVNTNITKNSNLNVDTNSNKSSYKLLEPETAAKLIIKGIEKNKFKLFLGSDSKFMRFFYKFNSKLAIKTVNKKMKKMLKL